MAISSDYPRPINVNGYVCRNCDDVSDARKFIDPQAPKGVAPIEDEAVRFGGTLAQRTDRSGAEAAQPPRQLVDRLA
jgi:hypothetical protein